MPEHRHEHQEHIHHGHNDHDHDTDPVTVSRLHKKSRIASLINAGSGILKMTLGISAASPVLATDAAHDFVDAWVYKKEGQNLSELNPVEKARLDTKSAKLLGQTAVAGALLETAVDMTFKHSPLPILGLIGAVYSYGSNYLIHKLFAHEHDHHAHGMKGHAETDKTTSIVTIGASVLGLVFQPALIIGAGLHVALFARNYKRQKQRYESLRSQQSPTT